jgi:ADP-ribosylglycohydrolase
LEPFITRLEVAKGWLLSGDKPSPREVRTCLGNGIAASESCVTAIYIALRSLDFPFLEMLSFVAGCRGDVDTIGAMAGAVWGAANGSAGLPLGILAKLEQRDRILAAAAALLARR